jgi:hypothetical protein
MFYKDKDKLKEDILSLIKESDFKKLKSFDISVFDESGKIKSIILKFHEIDDGIISG